MSEFGENFWTRAEYAGSRSCGPHVPIRCWYSAEQVFLIAEVARRIVRSGAAGIGGRWTGCPEVSAVKSIPETVLHTECRSGCNTSR